MNSLGNQYTAGQLEDLFWPFAAVREGRTIPANLQLPIRAAFTRRRVLNPDTEDRNGDPLYIVGKFGNTTKLTLNRYSGLEAYTCTDLGEESREVVVYNYSKTLGDFGPWRLGIPDLHWRWRRVRHPSPRNASWFA